MFTRAKKVLQEKQQLLDDIVGVAVAIPFTGVAILWIVYNNLKDPVKSRLRNLVRP